MPFDVAGARAAGYRDDEIAGYLSYTSGEPAETLAGTDEEKIQELLRRRQSTMLPYSYAEETPFDRAVAQPPQPEPESLSRPDATWQPEVPEEAVLPPPVRTARDWFRSDTMPVSGAPVGAGLGGPSLPDIPETAQALSDVVSGPTGERRAAGLSTLARTGMHGAMPLIAPHLGRAPVQTLAGLAYGMGGGIGAEHYLREAGVPEGYAALGGDIAGLGAGAVAGVAPWREVPSRMGDLVRNEAGEITISPSKGWTSTLRDLVEQKAPGRVSPQQLAAIAAQAPKEEVRWSLGDLARGTEPVAKSEVLEGIQQPEITEILRTPPDTKFGSYTLPGGEQSSELLLQLGSPSRYRSGHWEEPNVLAHARFNERTTPAGEKVLLVEELQSDWHQAGRKEGYQQQIPEGPYLLFDENDRIVGAAKTEREAITWGKSEEGRSWVERDSPEGARHLRLGGVPEAPFSKDWHELLMKRMIAEAIAKGTDKLAWTTGEQQNQRYNLSKHFDRLEWTPSYYSKTRGDFRAYDKSGNMVTQKTMEHPELVDTVGKELADRLLSQPVEKEGGEWEQGSRMQQLSGVDLEVGGEGMKGFYDKMLPDFARKYGKKFGANVSQSEIQIGKPGRRTLDNILREDFGTNWGSATPEQQQQAIAIQDSGKPRTVTVHSMDITPEMRRSLAGGQPLFGSAVKQPEKPKQAPKKSASLREMAGEFIRDEEGSFPSRRKRYFHSTARTGEEIGKVDRPLWLTTSREYLPKGGHQYEIDVDPGKIANFPSKRGYTATQAQEALRKTFPDITDKELAQLIDPEHFKNPHDLPHMIYETGDTEANALLGEIARRNGYDAVRMWEGMPGTYASHMAGDEPKKMAEVVLLANPAKASKFKPLK